jgi:hypothetical protein
MSRIIAVIACGFTVAGCSASTPSLNFFSSSPSTEIVRTQTVPFESKPPGAEVRTSAGTCRTPCELSVQEAPEISATFALNGYQAQTVSVRQEPNSPKLAPNPVFVELRATGKKHRKKKPPAVAAQAGSPVASAAPATPPAASAAAPASSPAPDAAPSATNYPWLDPRSAK